MNIKEIIKNVNNLKINEVKKLPENIILNYMRILTKEYHKDHACGPKYNDNWKTYSLCNDNMDINIINEQLHRIEYCLTLRKLAWKLHNGQEYPRPLKINHRHPIEILGDQQIGCLKIKDTKQTNIMNFNKKKIYHDDKIIKELQDKISFLNKIAIMEQTKKLKEREEKEKLRKRLIIMDKIIKTSKKTSTTEKHPITGKIVHVCKEGKIRNPKTGRCIKKCTDKQEHHPDTGKCVKKCTDKQKRNSSGKCIKK